MAPLGLSAAQLAELADVFEQRIYQLLAQKRRITPDTAVRLGRVFRMRPQHWLAFQAEYDLAQVDEPEGVRRADLRHHVTGPRGVTPRPPAKPSKPVDTTFSPALQEAVLQAAELLRRAKAR